MSDMSEFAQPRAGVWRGHQFDSQLEIGWAKTLSDWGMLVRWHFGIIDLMSGAQYEPDAVSFDNAGLWFEVKPWEGPSTDRLWKPLEAARMLSEREDASTSGVLLLRPPRASLNDSDTVVPGAVWESALGEDDFWVLIVSGKFARFIREKYTSNIPTENIRWSADLVDAGLAPWGMPFTHWSAERE